MNVYLAAPYLARDALKPYADELEVIGMHVTSRWLTEAHEISVGTIGAATDVEDAGVQQHCADDFHDIRRAAAVVVFTGGVIAAIVEASGARFTADDVRLHTGGRHVETGYALSLCKPVIVIGKPENVFHRGVCKVVPDWHRAVLELCAIARTDETADERAQLGRAAF